MPQASPGPRVAKILPATRKSGWPMWADSKVSGRLRARRRKALGVIGAHDNQVTPRLRAMPIGRPLGAAKSLGFAQHWQNASATRARNASYIGAAAIVASYHSPFVCRERSAWHLGSHWSDAGDGGAGCDGQGVGCARAADGVERFLWRGAEGDRIAGGRDDGDRGG